MSVDKKTLMSEIYPYFINDPKICLLVGDMGFAVLDNYFIKSPERVWNMGICEQATIGFATGLSLEGFLPMVYSQIPFLTMRAFEQIRYDINEHKLNIKLIGVGANNYFEKLGRSHCVDNDDISIMSVLKNFLILDPDFNTVKEAIRTMFEYEGPVYVRCI